MPRVTLARTRTGETVHVNEVYPSGRRELVTFCGRPTYWFTDEMFNGPDAVLGALQHGERMCANCMRLFRSDEPLRMTQARLDELRNLALHSHGTVTIYGAELLALLDAKGDAADEEDEMS